jgi:glycosyltransferase involved in cell wall biosynthesis
MPDKVSIVIRTVEGRENKTLKSVRKLHFPREVIVIGNRTPSYARNYGAYKATGDILVMLDDDLSITPSSLEKAISKLRKGTCVIQMDYAFIIYKSDYTNVLGGLDERVFREFGDGSELGGRMAKVGITMIPAKFVSHADVPLRLHTMKRSLIENFNESLAYLKYRQRKTLFKAYFLLRQKDLLKGFVSCAAFTMGLVYFAIRTHLRSRNSFW